jgi:hypothetical protein
MTNPREGSLLIGVLNALWIEAAFVGTVYVFYVLIGLVIR